MLYFVKSGSVRAIIDGQTPQAAAKEFVRSEKKNSNNFTRLTVVGNGVDDSMAGVMFDTKQLMDDIEEDKPKLRLVTGG